MQGILVILRLKVFPMGMFGYIIMFSMCVMVASQTCVSPTDSCGCFVDQDGKRIINCRYKSLTHIPTFTSTGIVYDEIIFHTTEDTGKCQYHCNNITLLNMNAFANLKVRKINLRNNPISTVSVDAFDNLTDDLEDLLLEGNGQVDPPYMAIAVLENLRSLQLENYVSSVIQIPQAILPLPRLRTLTLTKWQNLHTLEKDVFSVMTDLTSFHLQNLPSLQSLPVPTIQMFHNLETIEVTDTAIQSIPGEIFSPLQFLTSVRISHNYNLRVIDDRAFHGVSDTIVSLDLVENKLSNLNFLSSCNWTKLNNLNIAYNNDLNTLPSGIFSSMATLTSLHCQEIGLISIKESMFTNLRNLCILELSYNNIRNIATGTFHHSPNLTELHLNHQNTNGVTLNFQEDVFNGIENSLEILSLSGNKLNMSETWSEIGKLTNLKKIEMEEDGIINIPDWVFSQSTQLESINFANNKISHITQEMFYGPRNHLKLIDLQNNNIATVHQCVLNDFINHPTMYLAGNPLNCDCELVWLYDWLQIQQNPDTVYTLGICAGPISLAYRYFDQFLRSDICPSGTSVTDCPDLYTTTTTTTATAAEIFTSTSEVSTLNTISYPFELRLQNIGQSYIELTWTVSDKTNIQGYKLETLLPDSPILTTIFHPEMTSYTINNLLPGNYYTFCLSLMYTDRVSDPFCVAAQTTPGNLTTTTSQTVTQQEIIIG